MIHFERRGGAKILPSQSENYFGRKTKVLRYANDAEVDFELTTEAE